MNNVALEDLQPLTAAVQRKVFICGCGHSGTTILANILAGHPELYLPLVETNAFLGGEDASIRRAIRLFSNCVKSGKGVLVEKTPRHIRHIDRIRRLVPGACFIIPVRDGRDVAASIFRRSGDLREGMLRWIKDNAIVARQLEMSDVLVYRYEDFIEDTEAVVRRICDFIGVEFSNDLLRYHERPRVWFRRQGVRGVREADPREEHVEYRNWQVNQPLFDGRGKWRDDFRADDFDLLREGTGARFMRQFGYVDGDHGTEEVR